ncbi:Murein hydrolase activator NlpD [hydrothermal vent metagenome]|uniref:Murein hydrolase activator NlpD n=1 Tax=hydrothermal vent metagenome TaxID=652676 RepID=A0A3B0WUR5_9ZZZZ
MTYRVHGFSFVSVLIVVIQLSLSACSSNGTKWNPDDYTVKSGDTIYSVAWRYELDPESFAAWNGVSASYFIKPGQRLHTRKPYNFDANKKIDYQGGRASSIAYAAQPVGHSISATENASSNGSDKKWVKASKGDSLYKLSKRYGISVQRLAQLNQLKKPYVIQSGQTIFLKPLPASNNRTAVAVNTKTTNRTKAKTKVQTQPVSSKAFNWPKTIKWRRPAKGKVVKKFSRRRNDAKGIDIAGKQGDTIVASAAGKVVYSGNGLISYGNLIIIKHNRTYLSAYAYNRKLLVKEGDVVKSGQKIAEMGRKDKLSTRLHFEIRKNGKPVDPLKYLPW